MYAIFDEIHCDSGGACLKTLKSKKFIGFKPIFLMNTVHQKEPITTECTDILELGKFSKKFKAGKTYAWTPIELWKVYEVNCGDHGKIKIPKTRSEQEEFFKGLGVEVTERFKRIVRS